MDDIGGLKHSVMDENQLTIETSLSKVFKQCEHEGLRAGYFDEDLYSHRHRHLIITRILSNYIKKYLEVLSHD